MNKIILNTGVQSFIRNYSSSDILAVLLQNQHFEGITNKELVQQLQSRKKCREKLPTWYKTPLIYYSPKLSIEQSSSEITAAYKAELVSGNSLVDITGGFGVDSYYLSKSVSELTYCEKQEDLAAIAHHNFEVLDASNISVHTTDGLDFLKASDQKFDWVYLDPSRRTRDQSRVFRLEDAEPALPDSLDIIWTRTDRVLLKTSPWLDISHGMDILENIREIHVVSVDNEVKEVLWVLARDFSSDPEITAVNIKRGKTQYFNFSKSEERASESEFSLPGTYLFEPNSAILKAGAFKLLGSRLGLKKLHEHTHLYTADTLVEFPGRRFKIDKVMSYKPRDIKKLSIDKANISIRNFPISVKELRQKFRIKDGGDVTIFFTTDCDNQLTVLICSRLTEV